MNERPIIMSGESVRAILAGRKTQTRRVCKNQTKQPYEPGDRLWVKEAWLPKGEDYYIYKSVFDKAEGAGIAGMYSDNGKWHNPMFMPRKCSRLTLEVINVRLDRLHDMTLDDVVAEGFGVLPQRYESFIKHWDKLNAKRGFPWESNPWVWVIEFKRIENEK